MIKSFKHKGLERFYTRGTTAGIQAAHARRLRLILSNLDQAESPDDMDLPGLRLHPLRGDKKRCLVSISQRQLARYIPV